MWVNRFGLHMKVGGKVWDWAMKNLNRIPSRQVIMYDSIDVSQIPVWAQAVAGYVGGRWPTFNTLVAKFPYARKVSIAIAADENADCLDVEKYDATPAQAPAWVKRQLALGKKPKVYTSVSQAQQLIHVLSAAGITRSQYHLWTAHYTGRKHLCSPVCYPGFEDEADATQYYDKALGRNLDVSVCRAGFFS